jgi:hypothetical protein
LSGDGQETIQDLDRRPLSLAASLKQRWWSSQLSEQKSHFSMSFIRFFFSMEQHWAAWDLLVSDIGASYDAIGLKRGGNAPPNVTSAAADAGHCRTGLPLLRQATFGHG